ncbi:MAG: uncharacterized membrane protein YheB (UPF0754 family) [Myxococcota bacterium]|jgi:uncharacterized membrane protein YheB (UPF0754 family)
MGEYDWYLLALIPVISGAIGYITNVLAVKMMFHPLNFWGIPPYLGWQGIIPANAVDLAQRGLALITSQILNISDIMEDVDPDDFLKPMEADLKAKTRTMLSAQAEKNFGPMWNNLDDKARETIHTMAWTEFDSLSRDAVRKMVGKMPDILNLVNVVTTAVREKPAILSRMFLEVGVEEFKFIERSGWWFGLGFGLIQLAVWMLIPQWWVLPAFGFLVGWATNLVALRLVFDPKEPKKIGGITFHGIFHQRQKEVAAGFAKVSTEDMFNDANLFRELHTDHAKTQIMAIMEAEADAVVDKYKSHPMAAMLMTPALIADIKGEILQVTETELFKEGGVISGITAQSTKIRTMLHERMLEMEPEAFEGVLRPAFQQDEWKLILAGAVLGGAAGFMQLMYIFGGI